MFLYCNNNTAVIGIHAADSCSVQNSGIGKLYLFQNHLPHALGLGRIVAVGDHKAFFLRVLRPLDNSVRQLLQGFLEADGLSQLDKKFKI